MPYKVKSRQKRYYKRRYYRPSLSKKAYYLAKKAIKMNKPEYKIFDTTYDLDTGWTGAIRYLCQPPQGDGQSERLGDKIHMVNLTMKYSVQIGAVSSLYRVIIFYDKQELVTNANQFLDATGTNVATLSNKVFEERFNTKTLYDRSFSLSANGKEIYSVTKVLKINKFSEFEAGTTDVTTGSLKMLLISNIDPSQTADIPTFVGNMRVSYSDT